AEDCYRPQRFGDLQLRVVGECRARTGIEEVDLHLSGCKATELSSELRTLLERLAHADDPAAAHLHAELADELERLPTLIPRVGADDAREMGAGGLQIVVVAVHTEGGELLALGARKDPE